MGLAQKLTRVENIIRFVRRFGNPLDIARFRWMAPQDELMPVEDRESGFRLFCHPAAFRMFGEVWHDHDYDIPHLSLNKGDVVLDLGANHGFYTCFAASQGARVYAFEPDPTVYERLMDNVRRNKFEDLVHARQAAVAKTPGTVNFWATEELGGGRSTIREDFVELSTVDVAKTHQVQATTLAEFLASIPGQTVRVCKIDCEGAELDILSTLTPETARRIDAFVVEYHEEVYRPAELVQMMLAWGTHQVSFAEDKYCRRCVVRAVRTDVLLALGA